MPRVDLACCPECEADMAMAAEEDLVVFARLKVKAALSHVDLLP